MLEVIQRIFLEYDADYPVFMESDLSEKHQAKFVDLMSDMRRITNDLNFRPKNPSDRSLVDLILEDDVLTELVRLPWTSVLASPATGTVAFIFDR